MITGREKEKHSAIQLVECPRDAMQGWPHFIPTNEKIAYLNSLLKVGFHTLDFGSFVSPKAIPQMADTKQVLQGLDLSDTATKLLAIVANERGGSEAAAFEEISYLGFPFSISPTFQLRNTNSTIEESVGRVEALQEICAQKNKQLVVYLSMGFGNPYGDDYNEDILLQWAEVLVNKGVGILSLADTVGLATPEQVRFAVSTLISKYPHTSIGVHLHAASDNWQAKFEAALHAGCTRFDGALKGIGGCPMAQDDLVGNMSTEKMIGYLDQNGHQLFLDEKALSQSLQMAGTIFV